MSVKLGELASLLSVLGTICRDNGSHAYINTGCYEATIHLMKTVLVELKDMLSYSRRVMEIMTG